MILVVEDNHDSRDMMARILRHYQINYDTCGSAEEALERIAQTDYAGVVIDLALPEMDGWSLLEHLRHSTATAQIQCVAVTAYHSRELAVRARQAGFVAFFPKPFEPLAFADQIRLIAGG